MTLIGQSERLCEFHQLVRVAMRSWVVEDREELVVLFVLARLSSVDVGDLLTTQHSSAAQLVQQSVSAF